MTSERDSLMKSSATDTVVFISSIVVIALQIVLMQALSQIQGHHFAYLVISLALLGFGCSGTVIALAQQWMRRHTQGLIPAILLLAALSCISAIPGAFYMAAQADIHQLLVDRRAWPPLLAAGGLAFLPFFLLALLLGLAFVKDTEAIGRRYGANLLGSACGGGTALFLLLFLRPEQIVPLFCCLLATSAILFSALTGGTVRAKATSTVLASAVIIMGLFLYLQAPSLPLSPYKDISYARSLTDTVISTDKPHPMGRVQVARSPSLRYGAGLSLSYRGELPDAPRVYINGDHYGILLSGDGEEDHLLDHSVQSLPLAIAQPERALVLNAGSLSSLDYLLHSGISRVDAVEPHPVVANLLDQTYRKALHTGRLSIITSDSRSFLVGSDGPYDLVLFPTQGSFGGAVGLQALQEDYLLTEEAFRAAWQMLADDGILSVSLYIDHPPRRSLKLISLLVETLADAGITNPSPHLAALRSWDLMTLVISPSPLGDLAITALGERSRTGGFDRAWIPGVGAESGDRYHLMEDALFMEGMTALLERRDFANTYPFMIRAPSDDRPFFHQTLRWSHLEEARQGLGEGSLVYAEMGSIFLVLITAIIAIAAALLILAPLLKLREKAGGRGFPVLVYFAALGLGFMFLEILWIQRFILYWGHPLYSAAGVISAVLVGMGLGSLAASRIGDGRRTLPLVLFLTCLVITISITLITPIFEATLSLTGPARYALGLAMLAVPAFMLGMPFPLGLRQLGRVNPNLTAWAWGINGFFSVLAAPIAALTAMHFGFSILGWGVLAAYLAALAAACFMGTGTGDRQA